MEDSCQDEQTIEQILKKDSVTWNGLQSIVERYQGQKGSLVAVLQKVQDIYGYLPRPVMRYLAGQLRIKPAKIYGVATFYTQFRLQPVGKYLILLCQGTACHVNGSERIKTAVCEELKIKAGETTPDRLFTINNVACLGCCSLSPVMMINGRAYGHLTPDKAIKIIKDLAAVKNESEGGASD